jgi:hypothetical protein
MSLRILPSVSPRQSPSSAILFEISSDADSPCLTPDFFMFSFSVTTSCGEKSSNVHEITHKAVEL